VVRARQLTEPYTFNDSSGHERHGEPGDYLVQSSDSPRISRREIFEDLYVVLEAEGSVPSPSLGHVQPASEQGESSGLKHRDWPILGHFVEKRSLTGRSHSRFKAIQYMVINC
jgi:hypothetical protein